MVNIVNYWYQSPSAKIPKYLFFVAPFLIGLSFLYQGGVALRRFFYRHGFKKVHVLDVPVIVVGNITVGGTGKSPLVLYLTNYLIAQGWRPGIVSRGYKGAANYLPQMVSSDSDPFLVGDEPVMLARQTTCPVMICRDRVAAVKALLAQTDCNIIISDDGLQHYALHRDIEIAVTGTERHCGNGRYLPAGPLREPIARFDEVDFVCVQGEVPLSNLALPQYLMQYIPGDIYQVVNRQATLELEDCNNYPIHAVTGIGNPQQFFTLLRNLGFNVIEHAFPDHHHFTANDIDYGFESLVIMTEKDAVKCRHFADDRHWCLPISLVVSPKFLQDFQNKLQTVQIRRGY